MSTKRIEINTCKQGVSIIVPKEDKGRFTSIYQLFSFKNRTCEECLAESFATCDLVVFKPIKSGLLYIPEETEI